MGPDETGLGHNMIVRKEGIRTLFWYFGDGLPQR